MNGVYAARNHAILSAVRFPSHCWLSPPANPTHLFCLVSGSCAAPGPCSVPVQHPEIKAGVSRGANRRGQGAGGIPAVGAGGTRPELFLEGNGVA